MPAPRLLNPFFVPEVILDDDVCLDDFDDSEPEERFGKSAPINPRLGPPLRFASPLIACLCVECLRGLVEWMAH